MTLLVGIDEPEFEYPSYKTPGRILVRLCGSCESKVYRYNYEVLDHDSESSVFYIQEGTGFEYWLDQYCEFADPEGTYVVEGITGEYVRGEWGFTDDDEDWDFVGIRVATQGEIDNEALGDAK